MKKEFQKFWQENKSDATNLMHMFSGVTANRAVLCLHGTKFLIVNNPECTDSWSLSNQTDKEYILSGDNSLDAVVQKLESFGYGKKGISSIEELDTFLKEVAPDITNHEYENDGDLDSYSCEELKSQIENLRLYAYSDAEENYVPQYYGCGLLSRCLCIAQENGAFITPKFFSAYYNRHACTSLSLVNWY